MRGIVNMDSGRRGTLWNREVGFKVLSECCEDTEMRIVGCVKLKLGVHLYLI
jgi:hypothetical protein